VRYRQPLPLVAQSTGQQTVTTIGGTTTVAVMTAGTARCAVSMTQPMLAVSY
jgi:hypothetical protein